MDEPFKQNTTQQMTLGKVEIPNGIISGSNKWGLFQLMVK
jgi:hypothetical protein